MEIYTTHFKALELIRKLIEKHNGKLEISNYVTSVNEKHDLDQEDLVKLYDQAIEYEPDIVENLINETYLYDSVEECEKDQLMDLFFEDVEVNGYYVKTQIGASFPNKRFQYIVQIEKRIKIQGPKIENPEYGIKGMTFIEDTETNMSFERDNTLSFSHVYRPGVLIPVFCSYISKFLNEEDPTKRLTY